MKTDFSQVNDDQSYVSIPEGSYDCRITNVREGLARDGSVRWGFRLDVLTGEYAGRTAGWDALTWSDRGIYRVKYVLGALGFDTSGELELEPSDLIGLAVRAQFELDDREDPVTGQRVQRLRVPFRGYSPYDGSERGRVDASGAA